MTSPEPRDEIRTGCEPAGTPRERLLILLGCWRQGVVRLWRRKFLWLVLCIFTPGWLIGVYNWAAWPLGRAWQLAVVAVGALILLAMPLLALWLVLRDLRWRALLTPCGFTSLALWALLGVWLPYELIWWVAPHESATLEGVLAAVRFLVADALFNGALLWLGGALASRAESARR